MTTPVPHCQFIDPSVTDDGHRPGALLVTAEPPLGDPAPTFTVRVCAYCLWDVCCGLKEDGYHTIRVTAPEGGGVFASQALGTRAHLHLQKYTQ